MYLHELAFLFISDIVIAFNSSGLTISPREYMIWPRILDSDVDSVDMIHGSWSALVAVLFFS